MKKIKTQIYILLSAIALTFLMIKMFESKELIYRDLFAGLAILVMLKFLSLINQLSNNTYGNNEEN